MNRAEASRDKTRSARRHCICVRAGRRSATWRGCCGRCLLLLYVSALAAVVLTPVVRATSRLRIGRWRPFKGRAILILLLAVAGALTAFGFLAFPPVIRDLHEFAQEMPTRLPAFLEKLKHIPFADQVNTDEISDKGSGLHQQRSHLSAAVHQELGGRRLQHRHGPHPDGLLHP